jgi:capsular polysaccharide biosynthesis protein
MVEDKELLEEELDFRDVLKAIWAGKWVSLIIMLFFVFGSVYFAKSLPNIYKSTAILAPASSSSSSSLSNLAAQFGGLASIAGVNIGKNGGSDKVTIAMKLLNTWGFLEEFVLTHGLGVEVLGIKGWDQELNRVIYNKRVAEGAESITWIESLDTQVVGSGIPSSWEVYQSINERIKMSRDVKTGLVTLSVEHFSPHLAKKWVDLLIKSINDFMREQDRREALDSISYLKSQINSTSISEMRSIFYQLIEEQTKTLMLAEISKEYVLKTISKAKVAEVRSKPKRALIVIAGAGLGCFIAIISSLFLFYRKRYV